MLETTRKQVSDFVKEQETNIGPMPTMPIHAHCLSIEDANPHIFNMVDLWEVESNFDYDLMSAAIYVILARHDSLRLRFIRSESGWETHIAELHTSLPVSQIDLSYISSNQQSDTIEVEVERLQGSFDLFNGPLIHATHLYLGKKRNGRLLFMVHHFACDAFSRSVLLKDFFTIYYQLKQGLKLHLPPKSTSTKLYAHRLLEYASSEALLKELNYWITPQHLEVKPLKLDFREGLLLPTVKSSIKTTLSEEETRSLLALTKYKISIRDILLSALFQTYTQWSGERKVLIETLNHGRTPPFEDINLLYTVGWLNNFFPFLLDMNGVSDLKDIVLSVQEQVNQIPHQGLGYGVLRYLSSNENQQLFQALPKQEIFFNYLGRFPTSSYSTQNTPAIKPAKEHVKNYQSRQRVDPIRIWLTTSVVGSILNINWEYAENLYKKATIENLNQDFIKNLRTISKY